MSWEAIAAFLGLGFTGITSLIMIMRGLAKIEANLRLYFEDKQKETYRLLKEDINASREMFGETVKAIKENSNQAHFRIDTLVIRHQELELYIRDKYVEIDSFNIAFARIEKTIDGMDEKIDTLMDRTHSK